MIDKLFSDKLKLDEFVDNDGNQLEYIENVRRLNIFVGANNSGKSRLIRRIAQTEYFSKLSFREEWQYYIRIIQDTKSNLIKFFKNADIDSFQNFNILEHDNWKISVSSYRDKIKKIVKHLELISQTKTNQSSRDQFRKNGSRTTISESSLNSITMTAKNYHQLLQYWDRNISIYNRIYIPILRGLRNFQVELKDIIEHEVLSIIMNNLRGIGFRAKRNINNDIYNLRTQKDYEINDILTYEYSEDNIIDWKKLIYKFQNVNDTNKEFVESVIFWNNYKDKRESLYIMLANLSIQFSNDEHNDSVTKTINETLNLLSSNLTLEKLFNCITNDNNNSLMILITKLDEIKSSFNTAHTNLNEFYNELDYIEKFKKQTLNILNKYIKENDSKENEFYRSIKPTPNIKKLLSIEANGKPLDSKEQTLFNRLTLDEYFKDAVSKFGIEIITGLSYYEEIRDMLLGSDEERKKIKKFEKFLEVSIFNTKPVNIIPRVDSDVLYIKIGNRPERPIYDLGDGIQQIIILTFPIFKYSDKDCWFFIEEPEIYLHPGYQRKLIDIMMNRNNILNTKNKHKFFITTHSNHFLDLALEYDDYSIYSMKPYHKEGTNDEKFQVNRFDNWSIEILNNLGVRTSSVFLSNCIIWVEGVSDRQYLQKYIEVYQNEYFRENKEKRFQQDIHYSILEYGGSNIAHWSFEPEIETELKEATATDLTEHICEEPKNIAKNIRNKFFVIMDNDGIDEENGTDIEAEEKESKDSEIVENGSEIIKTDEPKKRSKNAKKQLRDRLQETLQDRFECLNVREIENLITPPIFKKILLEAEKRFGTKKKIEEYYEQLEKKVNELNFTKEDYKNVPLGQYIDESIFGKIEMKSLRKGDYCYKASSGTLKNNDKKFFRIKAYELINNPNDLSMEAKKLAKKLLTFIEESNKNH